MWRERVEDRLVEHVCELDERLRDRDLASLILAWKVRDILNVNVIIF
jgi:hypothetical protein